MATNTMRALIEQLGQNRDTIKDKLVEMGIEVAEPGKYSDVAEAASGIVVDSETTEIPLNAGQTFKLKPGNYYANEVEIKAGANEIDNKYYAGAAEETVSGTVSTPYTAIEKGTEIGPNGETRPSISTSIDNIVISAPDGYVIDTDSVTASASNVGFQPINNLTATPTVSDDGKTLNIAVTGSALAASSGLVSVTYSMTCVAGTDYTGGVAVTPSTEEQSFHASEGKVMTAFTVAAIETETKAVSKSDLIIDSTTPGAHKVTASEGKFITEVSIEQVQIGEATVDSADLYNGTTDSMEVTASSKGYHGLSKVIIPRPEVESVTQSVDLMDADGETDTTVEITKGYKSDSVITIETAELYNAIAAL